MHGKTLLMPDRRSTGPDEIGLRLAKPARQSAPLSNNVPVFDFPRGETALVTIVNGGDPALRRETRCTAQ